jgi:basic membrane lipoprotein Med (substrate-binding protein (PBP1-ABC) superfamily)/DNA-binding SARP family transcriptional activator
LTARTRISSVRFRLLGSLGAESGDTPVDLGPPKQRAVLAVLLLNANEIVSTDRIIDMVWGDDPPRTAEHSVQLYVSDLRKALANGSTQEMIETRLPGYVLNTPPDSVDSLRFERLVREALASVRSGDISAGRPKLERAMEIWTGTPLADFAYADFAQGHIRSLEELHSDALEALAGIHLDQGNLELARDLSRDAIEIDPLREEPRRLMMLTLYRSGRQAEALRHYGRYRDLLSDELGIEPSERLRDLEERILLQDPALDRRPTSAAEGNPYRGLRAFTEEDADVYFGRERLVEEVYDRLQHGSGLVSIVGPSGSGKSSAAMAGVVPRLREAGDAVMILQPGARPLWELAGVLERAGFGTRATLLRRFESDPQALVAVVDRSLTLVVDQFEELYTLAEPDAAARFSELIANGIRDQRTPLRVVATLRADYYDKPLSVPALAGVFIDSVVSVRPMTPAEVERSVLEPARSAGVAVEPALLAQLVADMGDEPGALPLLQFTLFELFERTSNGLTLTDYQLLGGLHGALTGGADELLTELDDEGRDLVEQLMMRMVVKGRAMSTARPVPLRDLLELGVDAVALQGVLEAFSSRRLLTFDRDTSGVAVVEMAHEYLIAEWPRMVSWIETHSTDLDRLYSLEAATKEWVEAERSEDYLLRGERLDRFLGWREVTTLLLTRPESDLIDASVESRERVIAARLEQTRKEAELARRARRRLWAFGAAVTALAVAVTVLVVTFIQDPPPDLVAQYDSRGDRAWGDVIANGLDRAVADFDLEIQEVAGIGVPYATIAESIDDGTSLVVLEALDVIDQLGSEFILSYPSTSFVLLDCTAEMDPFPSNAACVSTRNVELGYLAGVVSALASDTRTVGFIGGVDIPVIHEFQAGFEQGVAVIDPTVVVESTYLSGWNGLDYDFSGFASWTLAELLAEIQIARGADVIFPAAGGSAFGVFRAAGRATAAGQEIWSIGVDIDMHESFGDYLEIWELDQEVGAMDQSRIITSVVKRLDVGVYLAIEQFQSRGVVEPIELTLANGGVGYTTTGGYLDAHVEAVEAAAEKVRNGEVVLDPNRRAPTVFLADILSENLGD